MVHPGLAMDAYEACTSRATGCSTLKAPTNCDTALSAARSIHGPANCPYNRRAGALTDAVDASHSRLGLIPHGSGERTQIGLRT